MLEHHHYKVNKMSIGNREQEADLFASYLLAPFSVLLKLGVKTENDLREHCDLSQSASRIIYEKYQKWIENNYPKFLDDYDWDIIKIYFKAIKNN